MPLSDWFLFIGLQSVLVGGVFSLGWILAMGRKTTAAAVAVCPKCSAKIRGAGGRFLPTRPV